MGDEIQFDRAEYAETSNAVTCAACQQELRERYFNLADRHLCETCHAQLLAPPPGTPAGRFFAALGLGLVGGLVGFIAYYAVYKLTGYEFGLLSIGVGIAVGIGVRKGSHAVGGIGYQLLAVALTYTSIAATYYLLLIEEASKTGEVTGLGYLVAIPFAFALPFLGGAENLLGILIIGFGLWEAWKINRRQVLPITGPFELAARDAT
jgi:hypothetical protein